MGTVICFSCLFVSKYTLPNNCYFPIVALTDLQTYISKNFTPNIYVSLPHSQRRTARQQSLDAPESKWATSPRVLWIQLALFQLTLWPELQILTSINTRTSIKIMTSTWTFNLASPGDPDWIYPIQDIH